jgi:hypothetical protein
MTIRERDSAVGRSPAASGAWRRVVFGEGQVQRLQQLEHDGDPLIYWIGALTANLATRSVVREWCSVDHHNRNGIRSGQAPPYSRTVENRS